MPESEKSAKEKERNPLSLLQDAIERRDIDGAFEYLAALDSYLVGPGTRLVDQRQHFEQFVSGRANNCKIDMGDGGMSRLLFDRDRDTGEVSIGISEYNSGIDVKENWEKLQNIKS